MEVMTLPQTPPEGGLCWIHIKDVHAFLYLGANPHEQKIGQNIQIDLSIQIPYRGTEDQLSKTVDYGHLIQRVLDYIANLSQVSLLEYLSEKILDLVGAEFPKVKAAKLLIKKGYVPLPRFTGSIAIETERTYF